MSSSEAQYRLKIGWWRRVAGRGLSLASTTVTALQDAWALRLTWTTAVLWGPSALALWLPGAPLPSQTHVNGQLKDKRREQYRLRARRHRYRPNEVTWVGGLCLQTLPAAFVDTMRVLTEEARRPLFSWVLTREKIKAQDFVGAVELRRGATGIRSLSDYVEMAIYNLASEAERRLKDLFDRYGIAGWQANATIRLADGTPFKADFLFAARRLIIEVDGWAFHRDHAVFQADHRRDLLLGAAGYQTIRLTWDQIVNRPAETIRAIQQTLAQEPVS
ncbi:MAG: endonuclease domain-containing protein [Micrococcales bacterium]|nr:endonuclease domain-containing protein [Micrococcales bacterium]